MIDCPSRWADHPSSTPTFHHLSRKCDKCLRTGCVVPRCKRYGFTPASWQDDWTTTPASGADRAKWQCRACGHRDAPLA